MKAKPRPAFLIYGDDSGGPDDALRSVAVLSGPAKALIVLERGLRQVLKLGGLQELKWVHLRTKARRLETAKAFLRLSAAAQGAKVLRVDLLLWAPKDEPRAWSQAGDAQKLRALYAKAWGQALKAWPAGRWNVHPDRRTGMDWQRWPAEHRALWRKGGGSLRVLREAHSKRSACVQLCDLLAGLARLPMLPGADGPGAKARRSRQGISVAWSQALAEHGVRLKVNPLKRFPPLL